jgi:uncharacterized protein YbjT (DUF2867 family)
MTRRVVAAGATGQIGRPLCAELMRAGHAVVLRNDPAGAGRVIPARVTAPGHELRRPGLDAARHDPVGRPGSTAGAR